MTFPRLRRKSVGQGGENALGQKREKQLFFEAKNGIFGLNIGQNRGFDVTGLLTG
jgi:hypothetical protein